MVYPSDLLISMKKVFGSPTTLSLNISKAVKKREIEIKLDFSVLDVKSFLQLSLTSFILNLLQIISVPNQILFEFQTASLYILQTHPVF